MEGFLRFVEATFSMHQRVLALPELVVDQKTIPFFLCFEFAVLE
jgi:hypothetical protein